MPRTTMRALFVLCLALFCAAPPALAERVPRAVITDPAPDAAHPARMEEIAIPSGGVNIIGVAYLASGAGPHPTFILFHGLPGDEKNLDLAQSVRRAGWNVLTLNYRGSWGSPGVFSFAHVLEDGRAAVAFARDPANASKYNLDPARIAIGGHSMGGWVTAHTLATEPGLLGGVMISAGDLGRAAQIPRPQLVQFMDASRAPLAGVTGATMADEILGAHADWTLPSLAPALKEKRLLVLYSDDFVKADSETLIAALRASNATLLQVTHAATDHSWSDKRIVLQGAVVNWLGTLR